MTRHSTEVLSASRFVLPVDLPPYQLAWGVAAWLIVGILHVGVPVVIAIVASLRAVHASVRASVADARATTNDALAPGPACLHGPVETLAGTDHALRVEIEQQATNTKGKYGWKHIWTERGRKVSANAFYVRDARGRVRVEPDERTLIVDKLDRTVRHPSDRSLRARIAEVSPNEHAYVVGELVPGHDPTGSAYRGGEGTLVMRPPRGGRLLVSTEPLGERMREVSRGQRRSVFAFIVLVFVFAIFDFGFWARVVAGRVEVATIVEASPRRSKNSRYCAIVAQLPDRSQVEVDAGTDGCNGVRVGNKMNVYLVGNGSFAHPGSTPGLHVAAILFTTLIVVLAILIYVVRDKPWYEEKVVDRGDGKFEDGI